MAMLVFKTTKESGQKFVHEYPDVNDFINSVSESDTLDDHDIVMEASIDGSEIDLFNEDIANVDELRMYLKYM